jgi:hypothetical protein
MAQSWRKISLRDREGRLRQTMAQMGCAMRLSATARPWRNDGVEVPLALREEPPRGVALEALFLIWSVSRASHYSAFL